jgi:hypothetical protein
MPFSKLRERRQTICTKPGSDNTRERLRFKRRLREKYLKEFDSGLELLILF